MPAERRKTKKKALGSSPNKTSDKTSEDEIDGANYIKFLKRILAFVALAFAIYAYFIETRIASEGVVGSPEEGRSAVNMFSVVDLPGKGKGMIANRDIQQGELILREKPLFIVPRSISTSPTALIGQLVAKLDEQDRYALLNLSYVNLPKGVDPDTNSEAVALAIFETNAVAAGEGVGIFPRMARLNHGCSSAFNVIYTWREREGILVVHALKAIKKGEELLTSYLNTKHPRSHRRTFLQENYGFHCTCKVCSLEGIHSRQSDERLAMMTDGLKRLSSWSDGEITGGEAIVAARNIWQAGEVEGYWSERGQLAADAAYVAASHSDEQAMQEWIKLAIVWYGYELGKDSDQVREMEQTLANPRSHRAWGSREPKAVGGPGL